MPELPEVETIRRGLERLVVNKTIRSVAVLNDKSFQGSDEDTAAFVQGASIVSIHRRAKLLLVNLSSDYTLAVHLKMTGQLVYVGDQKRFGAGHPSDSLIGELPDRSTRAIIEFADDSQLFFNDQRKFGWIKLYPSIEIPNIDFMKRVGPEPLDDSFTGGMFVSQIRRRNGTSIKAALLDQSVVAGVGNIYADESLWAAQLHPARRVRDVPDDQLTRLLAAVREVMQLSLEKGGSTDKNYLDAEGRKGSYLQFAHVFRREGMDCSRCGAVIVKTRVAGRGTHICPVCQEVPS